jgi:hypothetical protein
MCRSAIRTIVRLQGLLDKPARLQEMRDEIGWHAIRI